MKFRQFHNSHGSVSSPLIKSAMLMAAGLGTRLLPFTQFQTKALLPVLGVPVAQYAIDSLLHYGVEQIVANVHHQASQAAVGISALEYGAARLMVSDESFQLLGSAGGIRKALSYFEGRPFFLANADVLSDVDWSALAACHQKLRSEANVVLTLTVFSAGPTGAKYREIHFDSSRGLITSLGALAEGRPYFVGAAVLEPEALSSVPDGVPSDFVKSILEPAISSGRAGVYLSQGSWFDIGEPKLWLKTHLALINMMEQGQCQGASSVLWNGRIARHNLKLRDGIWVSRKSIGQGGEPGVSKWIAPCYWNGESPLSFSGDGREGHSSTNLPQQLGPEAVLYGPCREGGKYSRGIGFAGEWSKLG